MNGIGTFEMEDNSELILNGHFKTTGDVTIHCDGKIVIGKDATFDIGGKLTIIGDDVDELLLDIREDALFAIGNNVEIRNGTIEIYNDAKIYVHDANQATFEDVHIIPGGNFLNGEIHIQNIASTTIDNATATLMTASSGFRIEGEGTENVLIENSAFLNCGNALILDNLDQVDILDSEFDSEPVVIGSAPPFQIFDGIDAKAINSLLIDGCNFDGFTEDVDWLIPGAPENLRRYAIQLRDVPQTMIESSMITKSDLGISVPNELTAYEDVNMTNVYLNSVKVIDNRIGIQMIGDFAESIEELNYGLLSLQCSQILDNYYSGISGINIRLIGDNYLSGGESKVNSFREHFDPPQEYGEIIKIVYTDATNELDPLLLRGNIWYDEFPNFNVYNSNTSTNYTVTIDPMYGESDFPTVNGCYRLVDFPGLMDDCTNCLQEDDNDGDYAIATNGKTIIETLREGLQQVSTGDLDSATMHFQHIADISSTVIDTLHSKSKYAYDISRCFAFPSAGGAGERSSEQNLVYWDLKVYPNPTNHSIQLEVEDSGNYIISDSKGNIVKDGDYTADKKILMENRLSGMYFIRYISEKGKVMNGRFILID